MGAGGPPIGPPIMNVVLPPVASPVAVNSSKSEKPEVLAGQSTPNIKEAIKQKQIDKLQLKIKNLSVLELQNTYLGDKQKFFEQDLSALFNAVTEIHENRSSWEGDFLLEKIRALEDQVLEKQKNKQDAETAQEKERTIREHAEKSQARKDRLQTQYPDVFVMPTISSVQEVDITKITFGAFKDSVIQARKINIVSPVVVSEPIKPKPVEPVEVPKPVESVKQPPVLSVNSHLISANAQPPAQQKTVDTSEAWGPLKDYRKQYESKDFFAQLAHQYFEKDSRTDMMETLGNLKEEPIESQIKGVQKIIDEIDREKNLFPSRLQQACTKILENLNKLKPKQKDPKPN
jgi:hypothetical protein